MSKIIVLSKADEKKGYPFFKLSGFKAWLVYSDGNKRCRLSIETNTTISQLLAGHKTDLILNRKVGYYLLCAMIERHSKYLKTARIYSMKNNIIHRTFTNGEWKILDEPKFEKNLNWEQKKFNFTINKEKQTITIHL